MLLISVLYVTNATLLVLHEIESAYWKEWEILRLPFALSGFLLAHIPIVAVLLAGMGLLLTDDASYNRAGLGIAILVGVGGALPFVVHELLVRRSDAFNTVLSKVIIVTNLFVGGALAALCIVRLRAGW